MENNETLLRSHTEERLLNDPNYFKYIFKKTEKIVCAVFYILRQENLPTQEDHLIKDIKESAKRLLNTSLKSLEATPPESVRRTIALKFRVLELESTLRLAHASNLITVETLNVFLNETDAVQRSLRQYTGTDTTLPMERTRANTPLGTQRALSTSFKGTETQARKAQTQAESQDGRRERILMFLKDKGEASIKDIADVITNCSEKTIQRDLNNLIKDNLVKREGERRWSKYKPV